MRPSNVGELLKKRQNLKHTSSYFERRKICFWAYNVLAYSFQIALCITWWCTYHRLGTTAISARVPRGGIVPWLPQSAVKEKTFFCVLSKIFEMSPTCDIMTSWPPPMKGAIEKGDFQNSLIFIDA